MFPYYEPLHWYTAEYILIYLKGYFILIYFLSMVHQFCLVSLQDVECWLANLPTMCHSVTECFAIFFFYLHRTTTSVAIKDISSSDSELLSCKTMLQTYKTVFIMNYFPCGIIGVITPAVLWLCICKYVFSACSWPRRLQYLLPRASLATPWFLNGWVTSWRLLVSFTQFNLLLAWPCFSVCYCVWLKQVLWPYNHR